LSMNRSPHLRSQTQDTDPLPKRGRESRRSPGAAFGGLRKALARLATARKSRRTCLRTCVSAPSSAGTSARALAAVGRCALPVLDVGSCPSRRSGRRLVLAGRAPLRAPFAREAATLESQGRRGPLRRP